LYLSVLDFFWGVYMSEISIKGSKKHKLSNLAVSLGSDYTSVMLFGDFDVRKCPDGSPVAILKNLDKAFPLFAKEWSTTVGIVIEGLKKLTAKLGVDLKQRIVKLYENLDQINGDLATHYRATYVEFAARPCDPISVENLRKQNENIRKATFTLREIQFEVEKESPDLTKLERLISQLTYSS